MWYSAVNLGYANAAVTRAMREQMERLPQLACQYLHREKIELAESICESIERAFGAKGGCSSMSAARRQRGRVEARAQVTGRQRMLAFQGGYHAARWPHPRSPLRTATARLRRVCRPRGVHFVPLRVPLAVPRRRAEDRGPVHRRIRAPVRARVHGSVEPEDRALGVRRVLRRSGGRAPAAT